MNNKNNNKSELNQNEVHDINTIDADRDVNFFCGNKQKSWINNVNKFYPNPMTEEQKRAKYESEHRPYLEDHFGSNVRVVGYISCKYKTGTNRYTIINVIEPTGKYVADHFQIDIPDDLLSNIKDDIIGSFVYLDGEVIEYNRGDNKTYNDIDYTIRIKDIEIRALEYFNYKWSEIVDILDEETFKTVSKYIESLDNNELYELFEELQNDLNVTTVDFYKNFFVDYIINQYFLNTATLDMYSSGLNRSKLKSDQLIDLIMITASTITYLKDSERMSIYYIFKHIVKTINGIQGVYKYTGKFKDKKAYQIFCETRLKIKGERKMMQVWNNVVKSRRIDFDQDSALDAFSKGHIGVLANSYIFKIREKEITK